MQEKCPNLLIKSNYIIDQVTRKYRNENRHSVFQKEKRNTGAFRQRIIDDIVSGALPFGFRLTIDGLAARYGISHMPVREALRELNGEGLLLAEPNRGARVRPVDAHFVECMFDTRGALEIMLTRRAAMRRNDAACDEMEAIEEALEVHVHSGNAAGVHDANRRLHHAIYLAADNPDALAVVKRYWVLNAALWSPASRRTPSMPRSSLMRRNPR